LVYVQDVAKRMILQMVELYPPYAHLDGGKTSWTSAVLPAADFQGYKEERVEGIPSRPLLADEKVEGQNWGWVLLTIMMQKQPCY
jgi:hypothetical protein